jgi:hypothetical protein
MREKLQGKTLLNIGTMNMGMLRRQSSFLSISIGRNSNEDEEENKGDL